MAGWSQGYFSETGYTYSYFGIMNPLRSRLALLNAHIHPPIIRSCCELGYGQGLSINIHASASENKWIGTDFNPSQAYFSKTLGDKSGNGAISKDLDFKSFTEDPLLPNFDYICLHGVWSWVSEKNRREIIKFVSKKLNPGGLLYLSYNVTSGNAPMISARSAMKKQYDLLRAEGVAFDQAVKSAIAFTKEMFTSETIYKKAYPRMEKMLSDLTEKPSEYIAHEFLNENWTPMNFIDLASYCDDAKLTYAGSANYIDELDVVNFTELQITQLNKLRDRVHRENSKDILINRVFRNDYWVKGVKKITTQERFELFMDEHVIFTRKDSTSLDYKVAGALKKANLDHPIYAHLIERLKDQKVWKIRDLYSKLDEIYKTNFDNFFQAIYILVGTNVIASCNSFQHAKTLYANTKGINDILLKDAIHNKSLMVLASPVLGGGLHMPWMDMMFTRAYLEGKGKKLAQSVYENLQESNQKLQRDGQDIQSKSESLEVLGDLEKVYREDMLPFLKNLMVI